MPETSTTLNVASTKTRLSGKVREHDFLLKSIILPFLIALITLIVFDLFLDHSHHSRMDNIQARITELEKDVATYRTEKQEMIDCFKYSKYWEYNKCFNN